MLEAEIKRLEAEYNMFFAGRLPRLPWEKRARVDAMVKTLRSHAHPEHRRSLPVPDPSVALGGVLRAVGAPAEGAGDWTASGGRAPRGRCRRSPCAGAVRSRRQAQPRLTRRPRAPPATAVVTATERIVA